VSGFLLNLVLRGAGMRLGDAEPAGRRPVPGGLEPPLAGMGPSLIPGLDEVAGFESGPDLGPEPGAGPPPSRTARTPGEALAAAEGPDVRAGGHRASPGRTAQAMGEALVAAEGFDDVAGGDGRSPGGVRLAARLADTTGRSPAARGEPRPVDSATGLAPEPPAEPMTVPPATVPAAPASGAGERRPTPPSIVPGRVRTAHHATADSPSQTPPEVREPGPFENDGDEPGGPAAVAPSAEPSDDAVAAGAVAEAAITRPGVHPTPAIRLPPRARAQGRGTAAEAAGATLDVPPTAQPTSVGDGPAGETVARLDIRPTPVIRLPERAPGQGQGTAAEAAGATLDVPPTAPATPVRVGSAEQTPVSSERTLSPGRPPTITPPRRSQLSTSRPRAGDAPVIQVRIGRVEVRAPQAPPAPAPPSRPRPAPARSGFAAYALARSHLDRTWS
jgi:hypothetical protein